MRTKNSNDCLGVHSTNTPNARLHLIAKINEAGVVFFACEQAPLLTLQSHGLPTHCPICTYRNPLGGDTNACKQE
jgi:hypothetical protein